MVAVVAAGERARNMKERGQMRRLAEALEARKGSDSLRSMARDLGVAPGTAEGWLKAWRRPGWEHVRPIADYLDEDIDMIIAWILEDDAKGVSRSSFGLVPLAA